MPSSNRIPSRARESFHEALRDTQGYRVDGMERGPAFITHLGRTVKKRRLDVRALPMAQRSLAREGTLALAARRLAQDSTSSVDLVQRALEVVHRRDPELNAFAHVAPERELLQQARALDRERAIGHERGPLHGIPVSIKDVIHVKGMPTTCSSEAMPHYVPERDATTVARLREAGAIIMGKTQTHEFALGVTTPQSRNPWDTTRDPGGSSGGSAISVATGMSLLGLGTDTRASIRVPAALCGIVGYKPTYGLVSTDGIITLSWSMDHAGLHGRTVEDVALMMNAVQGMDDRDPASLDRPKDDYTQYLFRDVRGVRVGLAANGVHGVAPDVLKAFNESVAALRGLGVQIVETEVPSAEDIRLATSLGLIVSRCEAATFHRAFPNAGPLYTPEVFEQLDEASQVKAVDYLTAQRFRSEFSERMLKHLEGFDALLMPTSRVTAPKVEESGQYIMILSENCIPWSFIGFPALSVPCGLSPAGLPVGAQLVAAPFDDGVLMALASALESMTPDRRP